MSRPCTCAARWALVACACSWRIDTKPLRVEVGWLYDDGMTTRDAQLSGLVYPDGTVDEMALTLDGGAVVDEMSREAAACAKDDLRSAAADTWRRAS